MLLFHTQSVGYDDDGKMRVKTSTGDDAESRFMTTTFSKATAGGRTRRGSSFVFKLPRDQLDTILSHALVFVLYPDRDGILNDEQDDDGLWCVQLSICKSRFKSTDGFSATVALISSDTVIIAITRYDCNVVLVQR